MLSEQYDIDDSKCLHQSDQAAIPLATSQASSHSPSMPSTLSGLLGATALASLSACGGDNANMNTSDSVQVAAPPLENSTNISTAPISATAAARFLMQAGLGATRAEIAQVQTLGYSGWLDQQMTMSATSTRWDWLVSKGMNQSEYRTSQAGFDSCAWRKLISSPDTLRQRICLALSEIFVVSIEGLVNGGGWKAFAAANYLDLLERHCFGNYRDLLQAISTSTSMSLYLTYRGNTKYNPTTGALPDENYAREIMQLFSIGLVNLNPDGSVISQNGIPVESYQLEDITGLARVFTGWDFDLAMSNTSTPDYHRRPLRQFPAKHETGASHFLGATIPAGISGEQALGLSLDVLFSHPNIAPFIARQLIQKLVTSNPTPAYIARVAACFANNGLGVRGDMRAIIKAILLDDEARNESNQSKPQFGKIREPMLRFLAWARAFKANSPSDTWRIGDTSDAGLKLGQSPLRSPSVFNFYRPGYVPPNTAIASSGLVAPEMQMVNESSVIAYLNFMQDIIDGSRGGNDLQADYSSLLNLVTQPSALISELNLLLAAGQLSTETILSIQNAVSTIPNKTDKNRYQRIYAAITLVLASPEFIVLK